MNRSFPEPQTHLKNLMKNEGQMSLSHTQFNIRNNAGTQKLGCPYKIVTSLLQGN